MQSIRFNSMFRLWNAVLFLFVISIHVASASDIDDRLEAQLLALGFPNGTLPVLVPAFGNYVDSVQVGKLLYLSSAAPQTPAGTFVKGRVPDEVDVDDAITAAKFACVRQVNRMKAALGDLNRVKKIVYISGKIQTQPDFINHTVIVDGCSAFLVNVFGTEVGTHARTVAGMASLSLNVTLEVETIVEVKCK